MRDRITRESAEILALEGLAWLAGRPDDIGRFLNVSGLDPADLRRAAGHPELLGAVLDFFLVNEQLLLDFCQDTSTSSKAMHIARHRLESSCG